MFYKYVRPKSKSARHAPTQHLFVSGSKGWIDDVREAVTSRDDTPVSLATYVSDIKNGSHFYMSFPTVEGAERAAAEIASMNDGWLAPRFEASRREASKLEEEEFRGKSREEMDRVMKKRNRRPRIVTQYADMQKVKVKSLQGISDNCSVFVAAEHFGSESGAHEHVCGIDGLTLVIGFVTPEDESRLLEVIDSKASWDQMARRRVQHYGRKFSYVKRTVDLDSDASDIPVAIREVLLDKVVSQSQLRCGDAFDQITVNEYTPGVGLSPHVDTHSAFGDTIISLSLCGGTVMVFRRAGKEPRAVYLPPRSLLIMSGEARWAWEHYIPHRKSDVLTNGKTVVRKGRRVSLTCRTVRGPDSPCTCPFPDVCDSQLAIIPPTRHMLEQRGGVSGHDSAGSNRAVAHGAVHAKQLEASVNQVYNAIAPHFAATRFAIWPKIRHFMESIPRHAIVADVGCGNGKYFGVRDDVFVTGTDRSEGLVRVARTRLDDVRADVAVCDGCRLPYRPCIDAAICIAVIHHMASVAQRVALIESISDILRPGGRAFLTAWATDQADQDKVKKWIRIERTDDDPDGSDNDFYVPWHLPIHRAEREAVDMSVGNVNENKGTVMYKRYIHLYEPGEIERLVERARGVDVVGSAFDKDNWCVEIEKQR